MNPIFLCSNMMTLFLTFVCCLPTLRITQPACVQEPSGVITTQTFLSVDKLRPGDSVKVAVQLTIAEGYHVNAHVPSDEFFIPTKLELTKIKGFTFGIPLYPKSMPRKVSFSPKPIAVYEGTANIVVPLTVARTFAPGKYTISGTLTYQSCNDETCLPPEKVTVEIPVEIVSAGTPVQLQHPEIFGSKSKRH